VGLGPSMLSLYTQLKTVGAFENVDSVIELGSQVVWCTDKTLLIGLYEAFGKPAPSESEMQPYLSTPETTRASSRGLHEALGFKYDCVDIDGQFGALELDMNFDSVPPDRRGKYGLTTNHGTTEHVFNQLNAFKLIHDLTARDGFMLHALPFTVHLEHGFFNYQPNLFDALARYNSYRTLGVWLGPDWSLSSLVPWEPRLLNYLSFNAATTHLLVVLQQKLHDNEFSVPIQGVYERMLPERASSRYRLVVDGEFYSGHRVHQVSRQITDTSLSKVPMTAIAKHLGKRVLRRLKLYSRPIVD
jgi:hypothetical protein